MPTALMPLPKQQFLSALGAPLVGGKVYTYSAGTNNLKATFTDAAATANQPNPIPLNARGEPDSPIYWSGAYKVEVRDAGGNVVYTVDNFNTDPAGVWDVFKALIANNGAKLVTFLQAGVGAVARTIYDKLTDTVCVFDYMTPEQIADVKLGKNGGGQIDVTDAWAKAMAAGWRIRIPAGYHRLTNFRPIQGKTFIGEGYYTSWIVQGDPAQYAFNALSDATVGPDHLWGVTLDKVGVRCLGVPTVAAVNVEANGAYSVQGGEFRFAAANVYQALRIWCPDAANVYNCQFEVLANGVTGAPAVRTAGAYNTYDFFLTSLAGKAVESWDSGAVFRKVITENNQEYKGFDNEIRNAKIEGWSGAAAPGGCIRLDGTYNRLYNWSINGVPNSKANAGIVVNAGTRQTIMGGWITGVYANDRCPQYCIQLGAGSTGVLADIYSSSPQKIDYVGWSTVKNWELLGDVSSITDFKRIPGRLRYRWALPAQGSTITMQDQEDALYLQAAGVTAVTINLPPNPDDGQIFRVGSTSAISGITWAPGAGKTVDGQIPTAFAAGGSTAMMYLGSQGQTRWVPMS